MTVRLRVLSDLHQEVVRFDWMPPAGPDFDVLVVAGDVREGEIERGMRWTASVARGKPAIFVAGNHEFWGRTYEDVLEEGDAAAARTGVTFLRGQGWVEVAGAHFVGCTLWTDLVLNHAEGRRLYDREFGEPLDVRGAGIDRRAKASDMLRRHRDDVASLERAFAGPPEGTRIVVTHHAPGPLSLPPAYRDRPAAAMSASNLTGLLDAGIADLWVHGHVHDSCDYVSDGGTRVLCNPFGNHGSNLTFEETMTVDAAPRAAASPGA